MRIAIFPGYAESAASSRLRAFTLCESLRILGHDARLNDATEADVVFVQKRVTRRTLATIESAIKDRTLFVYDVDDVGEPLWHAIAPSVLHRVLECADIVTTDTVGHRDLLLSNYAARRVEIIPDPIDYAPTEPVRNRIQDDEPLRILWFGNVSNLALFEKYLRTLRSIAGVEIVVVTNADAMNRLKEQFLDIHFLPWARETFVSILRDCTLTVLPHDGSEIDRAKSNNRMITSITWGVPAVVSRTPDYERTAVEAGVGWSVFSNDSELIAAIERLRSASARKAYLDTAQPDVWRKYSPLAVATRFADVIAEPSGRIPGDSLPNYFRWLKRASGGRIANALAFESGHFILRR